jgi:uncharacterized surface protein with fasciclin (FAS1) repeats
MSAVVKQNFALFFAGCLGLTGITLLISSPSLSQAYPPMALFQPTAYPNYPYRNEQGNLADSLQSNTNFENLVAELEVAGLTQTLQQREFTLLAPSDEAFDALPDEVFEKFSQPENRKKVLQYHLIPGQLSPENEQKGEVTTLTGDAIAISQSNNTIKFNDANPNLPPTSVSNGVIIEIDRVLLPPDF